MAAVTGTAAEDWAQSFDHGGSGVDWMTTGLRRGLEIDGVVTAKF
jgi:hypothetical protein